MQQSEIDIPREPQTHRLNRPYGPCSDNNNNLTKQEILEWHNLRLEVRPSYDDTDPNCVKRIKGLWYRLFGSLGTSWLAMIYLTIRSKTRNGQNSGFKLPTQLPILEEGESNHLMTSPLLHNNTRISCKRCATLLMTTTLLHHPSMSHSI
jgi:hypothetical protein